MFGYDREEKIWHDGYRAGYQAAMNHRVEYDSVRRGSTQGSMEAAELPPKKRRPSKYNREYARQFAILKKKHPRTQFKTLVKRAHAKTKKKLK